MLVIRRRPGESIRIGPDVAIEIIECGPRSVRLGISAPKEIPVWRAETAAARQQNLEAAAWSGVQTLPSLSRLPDSPGGALRIFPAQGFSERSDTGN